MFSSNKAFLKITHADFLFFPTSYSESTCSVLSNQIFQNILIPKVETGSSDYAQKYQYSTHLVHFRRLFRGKNYKYFKCTFARRLWAPPHEIM